jgi:uncharacterized protein
MEPGVTVTGHAERRVVADRASWTIHVVERDSDERTAYDRCTRRLNELLAALRGVVGDDGRVESGGLRLMPAWDDRRKRRTEALGTLLLEVDAERAGPAVAAAMDGGADRLAGPTFSVAGREAIYDALLADAVESARAKAELVASAAGCSLGRALAISEGEREYYAVAAAAPAAFRSQSAPAEVPDIAPPEEEIDASVTVRYELVADSAT